MGACPHWKMPPSWPVLINGYDLTRLEGDLAYLTRRRLTPPDGPTASPSQVDGAVGEDVLIPHLADTMLAPVQLRPSPAGRLASIVFKLPLVSIEVILADGAVHTYSFVPEMARSAFL